MPERILAETNMSSRVEESKEREKLRATIDAPLLSPGMIELIGVTIAREEILADQALADSVRNYITAPQVTSRTPEVPISLSMANISAGRVATWKLGPVDWRNTL